MNTQNATVAYLYRQAFLLLIASSLLWQAPAFAQPANDPLEDFVTTDGLVNAITETNKVLYFGGAFSMVGPRTGSGVPVSRTTAVPELVFPKINGSVSAAIPDGQGGWFVGGNFTLVGGFIRRNLAHIRSDRTVDPNWKPDVTGGFIGSLQLSGGTLYFGGGFTNVDGQTRNRAAALNAASGVLQAFDPNVNSTVNALVVYGTNVYLGGTFGTVSGQARVRIAAVDSITGQVTAWNPGMSSGSSDRVESLVLSSNRLFVGGYFSSAGGQTRSRVASFNLTTGTVESWDPNVTSATIVSPIVYELAIHQSTVFVAGQFTHVGGLGRVNIAAVDMTTGVPTAWDAAADSGISGGFPSATIQAMAVYSNLVYVSGTLINIGGQPRTYAAALDVTTALATSWDPKPNTYILTFSGISNTLYLGGIFSALSGSSRTNLAAFDLLSKQVTPWNPGTKGNVWSLLIHSNRVYVGGEFTNINNVARSNLAAVDLTSGALVNWVPAPNLFVVALARRGDRLYAGGGFTNIGGLARTNLAEFDLSSGLVTSWDPGLPRTQVKALAVDGNRLYVGGLFTTAGNGQPRRRIAAFDFPAGTLSSWDPAITNTGTSSVDVIVPFGDRVYIGGRFTAMSGTARTNFAAVDAVTAQLLPIFGHTDQPVTGLAANSNKVFIAGNFTLVGSQSRANLAAIDANTGALTSWTPNPDFFVQTLHIADGTLFPGGVFMRIGGQTSRGIAAFPLSLQGVPTIVPASVMRLGNGSLQFALTAFGAGEATVLSSSNLIHWTSLQTVPLVGGNGIFTDGDAPNHPHRFYRLRVP